MAGQEPGWRGRRKGGLDAGPAHYARPRRATSLPGAARRRRCGWGGRAVAGGVPGGPGGAGRTEHPGIWDHDLRQENGGVGPPLPEDPEHIDERRRAVGLPPLEYDIGRIEAYYRRIG